MLKKIIFIAIFICLAPLVAGAGGLRVSPAELKMAGHVGAPIRQVLLVQNPTAASSSFQVYPDDFKLAVKVTPDSFILQPQETKVVVVEAIFTESGVFQTNISVLAKPLSPGQFKANAGVKIPLEITVTQPGTVQALAASLQKFFNQKISLGWLAVVLLSMFFVVLFYFGFRYLKRPRLPLS